MADFVNTLFYKNINNMTQNYKGCDDVRLWFSLII